MEDRKLRLCNFADIDYFGFNGYSGLVKIVDIYDGDTCTIIFLFGDTLCKYRCRLLGINASELKQSKENYDRDNEIEKAKKCRQRFYELVIKSNVQFNITRDQGRELLATNINLNYCNIFGFDKYGRLLIKLFDSETHDGQTINQQLIDENLAEIYNIS